MIASRSRVARSSSKIVSCEARNGCAHVLDSVRRAHYRACAVRAMTPAERADACRVITEGHPCADQLVAHATEVMDRAMEQGIKNADKADLRREQKKASLWKA